MVEAALCVEAEYQLFCRSSTALRRGTYVAPSENDPWRVWDGLIFVETGALRGAAFGFRIHIPVEYPAAVPTLKFITPAERPRGGRVVHPSVQDDTLRLVGLGGAAVSHAEHKIIELLRYLRECLEGFSPVDPHQQRGAQECAERAASGDITTQLPALFAVQASRFSSETHGSTRTEITT